MRRNIRLFNFPKFLAILLFLLSAGLYGMGEKWEDDLKLAIFYQKNNQIEEALFYYQKSLEASRFNPKVYRPYYNFLIAVKAYGKAEEVSAMMLKRHPGHSGYVNNRAKAMALQEKYDEANKLWQDYLKKYGSNWSIYQMVSNQMLQSRMFDYAISTLEEGYKKFPGQHNLLLQIATLYQWRLSYIEALKRYLRYMEAVKNQFVLVQSRILNMLDNYDDAKPVIEYLEQRNNDYRYREIESSILLKFKKYDLAFPLLRDNYRPEQFSRYISYAREAQKRKNIDFAKKLLTFLFEKEKNETRRRELKLLNIELAISSLSDKAPLDSVEILAEELSSLYPTLQGQNKIKALKLFLQIYRDNLNDLDKAKDYARLGIEESANTRDADFFRFNLAKLYFREKNYSRVKSIFKQIKTASLKSEVLFLKLLANYGENGIERLEKELSQALKKIKPDDIRYNDLLELKLIISEKDSSIKILMLDGILNYYGHRYNIAGKYFTRTLENSALKIPLSGMAFEWLFKSSNYTDPRIFTEKALTYISGNPADELNPGLLLLLTKSDPGNAEKYMSKILEIFPKSLEASKVRSMIRKREAL